MRDPAEFVKKSQLATPAGVDRDYNYLKAVERSIDLASRDTSDRGIGKNAANHRVFKGNHPESIVQKYLVANRITMHRAPTGMSRQKANQTRASKRNHVLWTVDWISAEGRQSISDNCMESDKLRDLYATSQLERSHASKRRPGESERQASKRRRLERNAHVETATIGVAKTGDVETVSDQESAETKIETIADATAGGAQGCSKRKPHLHFYLLRPGTSSADKVLIPVDSSATLTTTLQDKTVLEFPTFYVLPYAPQALPPGYILEEQYLAARKREDAELDDAIRKAEEAGAFAGANKHDPEPPPSDNAMDPSKILDLLKRDVTR